MHIDVFHIPLLLAELQETDPEVDYIPAVFALTGALAGSLITGVIALISTSMSNSTQRKLLALQLEHAAMEGNRAERRIVYGEFIDCMERWNLLILDVATHVEKLPKRFRNEPEKAPGGQALTDLQSKLWDRWREAFGRLHLLASAEVDDLAASIFRQYQLDMQSAWDGGRPDHRHSTGRVFPITLMVAMQRDVGVTGGVALDPETGLRAQTSPDERTAP